MLTKLNHISAIYGMGAQKASNMMVELLASKMGNTLDTFLSKLPVKEFEDDSEYYWDIVSSARKNIPLVEARSEAGKLTKLNRYNDENYNNVEKSKKTCLERYGVENPMQNKDIQNKSKQTCLEKYGTEYVLSSDYFSNLRYECIEKSKQTCLERYGVQWNCMREQAHNSRNFNSKPNEYFANTLKENNISFSREFVCGKYTYDFKIDNILIEINPSATHNINFNPFSKDKIISKNYHKEKSLNALKNGYRCIHIFDWDDIDRII